MAQTVTIPKDYVLLSIEKEIEDSITYGSLELYLDSSYNEGLHRRIYGTVVAAPGKLSSQLLKPKNPGFPQPRKYTHSSEIERLSEMGLRGSSVPMYECVTYTPDYYRLHDYVLDIQAGDRAYFNYQALEEEARLWQYFDDKIYQIRYDALICVVRAGTIIPVASKALVVPVMQTWEEITSPSGIIMQSDIQPKYLEGIVTHIGEPLNGEYLDVKPGDKILYHPNADWVNKIEGKDYYVVDQQDILCVIE